MSAIYRVVYGCVFGNDKRSDVRADDVKKTVAAEDAEDAIRKVRADAKREWTHACDDDGNFIKKKVKCTDVVVDSVARISDLDIS